MESLTSLLWDNSLDNALWYNDKDGQHWFCTAKWQERKLLVRFQYTDYGQPEEQIENSRWGSNQVWVFRTNNALFIPLANCHWIFPVPICQWFQENMWTEHHTTGKLRLETSTAICQWCEQNIVGRNIEENKTPSPVVGKWETSRFGTHWIIQTPEKHYRAHSSWPWIDAPFPTVL